MMATKKPTRSAAKKAKPSKPPKSTGGGGEASDSIASLDMDSCAKKNSALEYANEKIAKLESTIRELHGSLTYVEDMWGKAQEKIQSLTRQLDETKFPWPNDFRSPICGIESDKRRELLNYLRGAIDWSRERTKQPLSVVSSDGTAVTQQGDVVEELRRYLYRALRSPSLPDERGGIANMLRRAPTAWHIRTVAEEAIDVLIHQSRREERETAAMRCLGEITRLFRAGLEMRASRSRQLREAIAHPAFLEALNRPPPKRTRGGTGGNESIQAIFTWTEFVIIDYDKRHNPDMLPAIYDAADEYMKGFLPYAKEQWETEDGPRRAEQWFGTKIRTNSNNPAKPKQSFGHFKKEIEENARSFIAGWLELYAPNVRDRGRDSDQS